MSREQRIELLSMLEKYGGRYLGELETVSFKSFEHIQGPGAIVASLVTEAEDSKIMMREFISRVKALQKDPDNIRSWLLLIRNFYVIADYAEDLNRRQIVKSTDYVGVRMLMPAVLDRILIPNAAAH